MYAARMVSVFNAPIELEYRTTLTRSKFNIEADLLADFSRAFATWGNTKTKSRQWTSHCLTRRMRNSSHWRGMLATR